MTLLDNNAHRKAWTTQDECTFIRQLYEWCGPERLHLYIQSCAQRRRWDGIDKGVVLKTARRVLSHGAG